MCLQGALCSIPFNLICTMTTFREKCVDLLTPSRGLRVCVKTELMIEWYSLLHSH